MSGDLKIFSGTGNPELANEIAGYLKMELGEIVITRFMDGENYCQIKENVRGADVFIVQPTCPPVNENLMELLIMIDAFRRASAWRITAVIPYYGYARQERKDKPRVPITAKLVANLLTAAGADRILTIDLHAPAIQGFFDIPVDHMFAAPVILEYIASLNLNDLCLVSPDAGGVERARALAKRLGVSLAIIDKRRESANIAEAMNVIGEVKGKNIVIVDDMIDTAGTLVKATDALKERGALKVFASCVHPILSGRAFERIETSQIEKVIVTNTVPFKGNQQDKKNFEFLSVADLLGESILRIHDHTSVSSLFV